MRVHTCSGAFLPPWTQQRAPFAPKNKPEENHWSFRDVEAMAEQVGTEAILLDADTSENDAHSTHIHTNAHTDTQPCC